MSNTEHAVQTTPSLGWVLEKMAERTATPVTPYGAWLALRGPLVAAITKAEVAFGLAAGDAAWEAVKAAKDALREFDRKSPKPNKAKTWKDVGRNDPLLQLVFGDKK